MSRYDILKINLTVLLGILCGYMISQSFPKSHSSDRNLASIPSHFKLGADFSSQNYFDLELNNVELSTDPNQASRVEIKITALKDFPNEISYEWHKHKNHSLNDEPVGTIPALKAGEVFSKEIRISGFHKNEQSHVSLTIKGSFGKTRVDRSAILASQMDQTLEHIVQQAAKNRQQQKKNNEIDAQSKINANPLDRFKPENVIK